MLSISTIHGRLGAMFSKGKTRRRQQTKNCLLDRAICDSLEPRRLLAAYFVTNTNDSGAGSLRQAIINANSYGAAVGISFDIPTSDPHYSGGVFTISPATQLPTITGNNITLDGSTQETYTGSTNGGRPVIFLNGANQEINGLTLNGSGGVISNIGVESFGAATGYEEVGVTISGPAATNDVIQNCLIGLGPTGKSAAGNTEGVVIANGASDDYIGSTTAVNAPSAAGDIISGNFLEGVTVDTSSVGIDIYGDYIGTDSNSDAIGNDIGVSIFGGDNCNNIVRGCVISDNSHQGVALFGSGNTSPENTVDYDLIGTNVAGTAALPNGMNGIYLSGNRNLIYANTISGNTQAGILDNLGQNNAIEANYIGTNSTGSSAVGNGTNGVEVDAPDNTIGGVIALDRNVISGNANDGIFITLSGTSTTVTGNYIGTNAAGSAAVGNGFDGVEVATANNTIGGTTAAARNIISGNSNRDGVVVEGSGSTGDIVEGNYVGTNASGSSAIPNSSGVEIISSASGDSILSNLISGNSNRGVGLFGSSSTSSTVQGNNIGTDYTGTLPVPNFGIGILVSGDESVIGGSAAGQGNTIGFNDGGGISVSSSNDATVTDSTIYNNSNGGINNAGTLYIYNCTITGNTAASGAGIYTTSSLQCLDDTISLNTASSTGGGIDVANGTTSLLDTIVAQNTGGDVTGAIYSASYYNLIGNGTGLTGITSSTPGDQIGTQSSPINAVLGPLAFNGGTTETMAPKAGSPAYNAGSGGTTTDQRGVTRPGSVNDIGAVQRAFSSVTLTGEPAIYLRLANDGQTLDIYYSNTETGTPASTYLLSDLASLSASGTSGNDQITIDTFNGIPLPMGSGFSYNGLGGTNTFEVIGSLGAETVGVNATNVTIGSYTAGYSNVQVLLVNPLFGNTSLSVAAGLTVYLPAAPLGGGILRLELPSLILASNSKLILPAAASHTDRISLLVPTLSEASGAALDMGDNDAFGFLNTLTSLNSLLQTGFNAGGAAWTGPGIDSSTAASDPHELTALAVVQNNQSGTSLFSASHPFDGLPLGPQVLVLKYTYYGDTNLDGTIDGSDYSRIDNGYLSHGALTGWINGDFNYDGVVNGSDYTLIDNAFNSQGASLTASIAPAKATAFAFAPTPITDSDYPTSDEEKIKPVIALVLN